MGVPSDTQTGMSSVTDFNSRDVIMAFRTMIAVVVLPLLFGCSEFTQTHKAVYWRSAQLEYEPDEQFMSEIPSVDPGQSIVLGIFTRWTPPEDPMVFYHPAWKHFWIQIPDEVKRGDVITVRDEPGRFAYEHVPGYNPLYLDVEAPWVAKVRVTDVAANTLTAQIDLRFTAVSKSCSEPKDQWPRLPVHYRSTETFLLAGAYQDGIARELSRLEAEIEATEQDNSALKE